MNDLEDNLKTQVRFFADDTSLFSVVHNPQSSAEELNHDLDLISEWAHQWKMCFNPDPTKPAEEFLFSAKRSKPYHPPLLFNGVEVKKVKDHKHLGLILDSKINFISHINEKITRARKGIGIIRKLSSYVPIKSLDQIYKMHVRSHLDYCDIIFHRPKLLNDVNLSITYNCYMAMLESVQYQAALAITGAWKGTSREKIYKELGWESLDSRRVFRRLCQFYKIINGHTPEYLRSLISPPRLLLYGTRSTNPRNVIHCRTDKYQHSFFPNTLSLWNDLGPEIRGAVSLSVFKENMLKTLRPVKRDIFGIHDPVGTKMLFQLRVGLSVLRQHKFKHKFRDTPNDKCLCNRGIESTCHFLLECPLFVISRNTLLESVRPLLFERNNLTPDSNEMLVKILLYGHDTLSTDENCSIIMATIKFIKESGRFAE